MNIGRLKRVPLRVVWPNEADNFTLWLEENLDVLSEVLDIELASAEREQAAGSFRVDLLAEDTSGNVVVIENQLEKSDHDHLGKLITYLTNFDATAAIWIVAEPRPEHVTAITWLNEASSGAFYLIKAEAVKIGSSDPAPLLTLIVGPSEEGRQIGEAKRERSEHSTLRYQFWQSLLEKASKKTDLHTDNSPHHNVWLDKKLPQHGLYLSYNVNLDHAAIALRIDCGPGTDQENVHIFEQISTHKEAIDRAFEEQLIWFRRKGPRSWRIQKSFPVGYRQKENWDRLQDEMIDNMIRFEKSLRHYLEQIY